MAVKMLNIEVGARLVKVCLFLKRSKGYQLQESFLLQTPDQSVNDGQITDPKRLGELLKEELRRHGAGDSRYVTFTLTSPKVATREVLLPPVKDNRIKSIIETNASDYFPVDMSKYRLSYNLLERVDQETPGCRVQIIAAPRILLESYVQLAAAAGLQTEAIDFCGNSQYQVLRTMPDPNVVMYVDVNVNNTFVTFMRGGTLLLQRNFSVGGDELVRTAMAADSRDDQQYIQTLLDAEAPEKLLALLDTERQEDCLSRLVSGIVRSADFFKSDHTQTAVSRVVLMGTCHRLAGLSELVSRETGLETSLLGEVPKVEHPNGGIESVTDYISCIGSRLAPLDLLPDELRPQKKQRKQKRQQAHPVRSGVLLMLLFLLAGAGAAGFSIWQYQQAQGELQAMEARIAELAPVEAAYQTYLSYQSTDDNLTILQGYAQDSNSRLVAFLEELEQKMPSSILLLSAVCSSDGVTMNIIAPGMEEAAVVLSQLRSFESIAHLQVSTITEATDDTGFVTAAFSVSCGYAVAEAEGEPAEPAAQ